MSAETMWPVEPATEADIPAWLNLAAEVGPLFGADMASDPSFVEWLHRTIHRGTAFCIRVDGGLAGAISFHDGWIGWLAVRNVDRGNGIGRALVSFAQASALSEIRVVTFGLGHPHPDAGSGRGLYRAMGFLPTRETPALPPDGTPREILLWTRAAVGQE